MKKNLFLALSAIALAAGVGAGIASRPFESPIEVDAAVSGAGITGQSGEVLFVSGASTYFIENQANLAVYFWRDSPAPKIEAWVKADRSTIHDDMFAVSIPKHNNSDVTWDKCIVTRFNPTWDQVSWADGGNGVYNQTEDIKFSDFSDKNVISPSGYSGKTLNHTKGTTNGIASGDSLYLNIDSSTNWTEGNAKIACFFFGTTTATSEPAEWSEWASVIGTGNDNSHVMKVTVPQYNSTNVSWMRVIVARFSPDTAGSKPTSFTGNWGQTGNYYFKNAKAGDNALNLDKNGYDFRVAGAQAFADSSVANYYGQYFIDNVGCDSSGISKPSGWNTVKSVYGNLPTSVQTVVVGTTASQTGSSIAKAMATYDWAVVHNPTIKGSADEKFITGRSSNGAGTVSTITGSGQNSTALIAGLAVLGLAAGGTMVFLAKRRKEI